MPGKETRNTFIWGTILFLAAAAGLYVFGYQPWRDGLNHVPKVTLSFKALLVSSVFVFLGGAMLWAALTPPPSAETTSGAPGTPAPVPRRAWILLAAWFEPPSQRNKCAAFFGPPACAMADG